MNDALTEMFHRWSDGYGFNEDSDEDIDLKERAETELAQLTTKRLIAERKFYRTEWPLDKLLEARNGGLVTDEGEAWFYSFTSKDGRKGEYDMLFRRVSQPESIAN